VKYIRNYIAIQNGRMDERIAVSFCNDRVDGSIKIAPLILITFVENAFKYVGLNEYKDNRIDIILDFVNGNLQFRVFNTKERGVSKLKQSSGLGIANTRRRLELLYPDKHLLEIRDHEDNYEVTLIFFNV
jgi:two-component system, LytTR family, sensor kinase